MRWVSPAGEVLLLVLPRRSTQEESAPAASPGCAGCSALLSRNGGLRNSGLRPSDSPRPFSRCVLRCSTTQRARGKPNGQHALCASNSARCLPPLDDAEQRSAAGGSRRGLSEGQSPEFRSRPAVRVAQGSRQSRPRNAGVAFSLAPFFWRPKRKDARASGAENSVSESQQRPKRSRCQPFP